MGGRREKNDKLESSVRCRTQTLGTLVCRNDVSQYHGSGGKATTTAVSYLGGACFVPLSLQVPCACGSTERGQAMLPWLLHFVKKIYVL